jgi:sigma-E factor negative regulatory protein RseC
MSQQDPPIETFAQVRSIDAVHGLAWVEAEHSGCGRCHEPGGCGGGKTQLFCQKPRLFQVENPIAAPVGARVTVVASARTVSRAASLAYVLPLFGLLFGSMLGRWLAPSSEVYAVLGAVIGVFTGWALLRRSARSPSARPRIEALALANSVGREGRVV